MTIELMETTREESASCASTARAWTSELLLGVNGARLLEESIGRDQRRKDGVFFSGLELAEYVANRVKDQIINGATIADPTCGGGDLLLACLRLFATEDSEAATARSWGSRVKGLDLQPAFVEASRLRMAALARSVHTNAEDSILQLSSEFHGIIQGDYMQNSHLLCDTDVIVANPPFGSMLAPEGCTWSSGKTQRAAVFLDQIVTHAKKGQNIVAVLPDVLRSGSRYKRWRSRIEQDCEVLDIHRYGRFGESADIDVFVLHLCKWRDSGNASGSWSGDWVTCGAAREQSRLAEEFDVRIGPLVPHRHGSVGAWCYYLDVSAALPNEEVAVLKKRRFTGRLAEPPFVAIRRTSSPSDRRRIVPTIVKVDAPVAVENHLIILSPRKGGLAACQKLMQQLSSEAVNDWVNDANGCRHLTKGLVENIPVGKINEGDL